MKDSHSSTLNELEEIKNYCHVIRDSILWIAETILFTKQFVQWKIPKTAIGIDQEIDWKQFEEKSPKEYKAFTLLELFSGLNNDFLHFTNFSLKSLHPATMAVSYSLSRKPFRDTLMYLEYLYVRQDEFFFTFSGQNPKEKNKDLDNKLKRGDLRKKLVQETLNKLKEIGSMNIFLDHPDHIYDFRYKTEYTGFFDSAMHLITSRKHLETEDVNMNFIFLNNQPKDAESHSKHLLRIHLTLLSYSYELMYSLMIELITDFFTEKETEMMLDYIKYLNIRRIMSNISLLFGHRILTKNQLDKNAILVMMKILKDLVEFKCSCCGSHSFSYRSLESAKRFILDEEVMCEKCKYPCKIEKPPRLTIEYGN